MKKNIRLFGMLVSIGVLIALSLTNQPLIASANSAQKSYFGISSSGVMLRGESPIVVRHEDLVFEISEFPEYYFGYYSDTFDSDSCVTAKYEFENPSEYAMDVTLAFPFAYTAEGRSIYESLFDRFRITADGEEIDRALRYTYTTSRGDFNIEEEMQNFCDEKRYDLFPEDLPVYEYMCDVSSEGSVLYFSKRPDQTILAERIGHWSSESCGIWLNGNSMSISIYFIGEDDPDFCSRCEFYEDMSMKRKAEGRISVKYRNQRTFQDIAYRYYDSESGIGETDWYNAVVAKLSDSTGSLFNLFSVADLNVTHKLRIWFEYSLHFEPGQVLVNSVEAPLIPDLDMYYIPSIYSYEYLLSPAATWSSFGTLSIEIHTPFYMTSCGLDGFEETEYGYAASFDQLPETDFYFSLCSDANPKRDWSDWWKSFWFTLIYCMVIMVPLLLLMIVVAVSVNAYRKSKLRRIGKF